MMDTKDHKISILFDLDGTLTDSGPGIMNCAEHALKTLGYAVPSREPLRRFVGPPLQVAFSGYGVKEEEVEQAISLYREQYQKTGKYENTCYEGIRELLEKIHAQGIPLYVATSKPETLAAEILHGFSLDSYFTIIAGATFDHTRENKDDVIRYLLAQCPEGISPVMVGDTAYDVIGAKKMGLPCIGVSWGYGDVEEMKREGACAIVRSPEELFETLSGWSIA